MTIYLSYELKSKTIFITSIISQHLLFSVSTYQNNKTNLHESIFHLKHINSLNIKDIAPLMFL